jgi:hypothetical protein
MWVMSEVEHADSKMTTDVTISPEEAVRSGPGRGRRRRVGQVVS